MPSLQKLTLITLLSTLALSSLAHPLASEKRRSPNHHKKRHCARPSKSASPSLSLSSLTMPMATGTATEEDGMMSILPVGDLSTAISDAGDAPTPVGEEMASETASASIIGNQLIRTGTGRRHRTRTTGAGAPATSASAPTPTPIPTTESVATTPSVPVDSETLPTIIPNAPTSQSPPMQSSVKPSSAVPVTSAPAATSAAPPATGGGNSSGKARAGLAVNGESGSNWSAWTGGNVDWLYNWGSSKPANLPSSIEYVPMLWGTSTDAFVRDSASFDSWGVTSVLSFNEPDMGSDVGGSRIGAAEAAKVHQQVFTPELNKKFRIGGPAVARGGKGWLQEFEAACGGNCLYDFLPIHFYGKDASQFAPYLQEMLAFNKPLWVTEVACIEFGATTYYCNEQENEAFMKQIIKDMNDPVNKVERHSWFGAFLNTAASGQAFGIMNTDGSPNALGKVYMTAA